jgi:hypothetical protein
MSIHGRAFMPSVKPNKLPTEPRMWCRSRLSLVAIGAALVVYGVGVFVQSEPAKVIGFALMFGIPILIVVHDQRLRTKLQRQDSENAERHGDK